MVVNEVNVLQRQLNRHRKLQEGSQKLLKNTNNTPSVQKQAQQELISSRDSIREIEMKLTLANRLKEIRKKKARSSKVLEVVPRGEEQDESSVVVELDVDSVEIQLLQRIDESGDNPIDQIEMTNQLIGKLQKSGMVIPIDLSRECILHLLGSNYYQVRICGIRILRFSLNHEGEVTLVGFDSLLVKCLKDTNNGDFSEMMNLMRDFIERGKTSSVPEVMLIQMRKSFQHVISNGSNISSIIDCIEMSCEICLLDPLLGFSMRFLNLVTQTLLEPPYPSSSDVSRSVKTMQLPLVLKYIDNEEKYQYLEDIGFIPSLISQLIDSNLNSSLQHNHLLLSKRMNHVGDIICRIMRSERGIDVMMADDFKYFKMIINGLYSDSSIVKNSVMGVIANGLRIRKLVIGWGSEWYDDVLDWEKLIINNGTAAAGTTTTTGKVKTNGRSCPEVEDEVVLAQMKRIIRACLKCQVPSILMEVYETLGVVNEKKLGKRVILLLSEMVYLKGVLLADEEEGKTVYMGFKINNLVERELKKHQKLNERNKNIGTEVEEMDIKPSTIVSLGVEFRGDSLINRIDNASMVHKLRHQTGEVDYKAMITSSHILSTKEDGEWDWELVTVLLRGVMWNARILEETLKTTKFFKRLLSYYNPLKAGGFNGQRRQLEVAGWLFELLLSHEEGVDTLRTSGIIDGLKFGILHRASSGAVGLLGGLSKWVNGVLLLEEFGVVNELFAVEDEALVRLLVDTLEFKLTGQLRVLLSKWSKLGQSLEVKMGCVERVYRDYLIGNEDDYSVKYWGCSILVEGLIALELPVRELCEERLVSFIASRRDLDVLLALGVNLRVLGSHSRLVCKVLGFERGVEYYYMRWPEFVESSVLQWWSARGGRQASTSGDAGTHYATANDWPAQGPPASLVDALARSETGANLLSRFVDFPTKIKAGSVARG